MISAKTVFGGGTVRKSVVINSSQTWTAPAKLAGNTAWLTGTGGGGSGAAGMADTWHATGGCSGAFGIKVPVTVAPSTGYSVVIGAGGAANGGAGGNTTFAGTAAVFVGGAGGKSISKDITDPIPIANYMLNEIGGRLSAKPMMNIYGSQAGQTVGIRESESLNGNVPGASIVKTSLGQFDSIRTGGAAGLFGSGTAAVASGNSGAAATNSGAGSGAAAGTSGAGGSGRLIIEWDEFL